MKKILTISFIALSFCTLAQRDPNSTMFWNNYSHFNPSMSGLEYKYQGSVTYRNQWRSLNYTYNSAFVNYSMLLGENHGVGINYIYDSYGPITDQTINLNYNYQIRLDEDSRLSLGVATGIVRNKFDGQLLTESEVYDTTLPENQISTASNSNVGIAYSSKKVLVGIGITHLFNNWSKPSNTTGISYKGSREYYVHAHYKFPIGESFEIRPQVIIRSDLFFTSTDFNLLFTLKNKYWIGASYRNKGGIGMMLGWDIVEKWRISYSYDVTVSKLSNGVSRGAHEFGLGFLLK